MADTACAMSRPAELRFLIDELTMLFAESAAYHHQSDFEAVFRDPQSTLQRLRRRVPTAGDSYVVAIVGLGNVGKSTLLNGLFGADLAPRRNGPCTATPVEFCYGQQLAVTARFLGSVRRARESCDGLNQVQLRLRSLADSRQGENHQIVERITVELPYRLLPSGLVIADTPGFGAAEHDTANQDDRLREYLDRRVSQVFWVVMADQGIGDREFAFHGRQLSSVCDDLVVTGSEEWPSEDRQAFKRRFGRLFGHRMPTFHFVSGLEAVRAIQAGDTDRLAASGIPFLRDRLKALCTPEGRMRIVGQSLLQLASDVGFWLSEFVGQTAAHSSFDFWRPDSLARWLEATRNIELGRKISRELRMPHE